MAGLIRSAASAVTERARAHPLLALACILGLSTGVYVAVVLAFPSDAVVIKRLTSSAARACVAGDADAVMEHVSPFFREVDLDKGGLARSVRRALAADPFTRMHVNVRHVDVAGARATAAVHVTAYIRTRSAGGLARSEWRVGYERVGDRWLICSATPLDVNGRRIGGLLTVLSMR